MKAILALHNDAFDQEDEANIVEQLSEDGDSLLSLVAVTEDGVLIGHIQFFPIEVKDSDTHTKFAGFGPVSVTPDLQSKGIGGALILEGIAHMDRQGIQKLFVLGHTAYYPRFGFNRDDARAYDVPWQGKHFMALRLNAGGPADGKLSYPAAFG